jgi:hypothetical protein
VKLTAEDLNTLAQALDQLEYPDKSHLVRTVSAQIEYDENVFEVGRETGNADLHVVVGK